MYHFPPYPIHTAPRDGTRIFIVGPDDGNLYESWWNPAGNSLTENGLEDTGAWFCETGGWFEPHEVHFWVPCDTPTTHYLVLESQKDKPFIAGSRTEAMRYYHKKKFRLIELVSVFPDNE